jgi:ATP-dependent Clp protease adapter protein ClpS
MISRELEIVLHEAFVAARDQRHQFIGVEHLLLALLDSTSAARVLEGGGADVGALRKKLTESIAREAPAVSPDRDPDTQPTLAFQRVIQRAILKVQSSGRKEVTGTDVLFAILADAKKSRAAELLVEQGITPAVAASQASLQAEDDLQVVIYSDDATPMTYVVDVLEAFFDMTREDATGTMLELHREGAAVCGRYSRQTARELVEQVRAHAAKHGWPLRCAAVKPK